MTRLVILHAKAQPSSRVLRYAVPVSAPRRSPALLFGLAAVLLLAAGCAGSASGAGSAKTVTATGIAVRSAGCAQPAGPEQTESRQSIDVGGVARWYLLSTPSPPTPGPLRAEKGSPVARPLVLDFHGLGEGAILHATTSGFGTLGQRDGFDVAFPNGTGTPVQWDTGDERATNPDLEFVRALLDQIESTTCIDTSRVYASGFSDGSFMVSLLACTMSRRITAIGAVSGLQLPTPCPTTRRVPVITFHGTADPIVFFNGGIGTATLGRLFGQSPATTAPATTTTTALANLNGAGIPATVSGWAKKDGCDGRATNTRLDSQVVQRTYRCPPGAGVVFYIILGGGHAWPGSAFSRSISAITGFTTFQVDATTTMWSFFKRFAL
jgi:polyhydroxybutyrate depolymerase